MGETPSQLRENPGGQKTVANKLFIMKSKKCSHMADIVRSLDASIKSKNRIREHFMCECEKVLSAKSRKSKKCYPQNDGAENPL